ncbi:HAD family hydrolase [Plantactinospora solaniradicis]|uniref:HAD family hydrolase n=1 Tax=Plantactinospora solaniradicis TaxID=1723736 RepID=A0ABW1KP16_9ACTN
MSAAAGTGPGALDGGPARGIRTSTVVFDLDGTLVDTMATVPAVYADTIRTLGGPDVPPAAVVAAWHIGATPAVLAHFLGRPASTEDVECYHRNLESATARVRPFPGVPELVDELRRAGCRLGIFTAATRRATSRILAGTGLDRLFPVVVCGDEVGEPKPAPHGLWLACRRLGVDVADTVYVGDAEVDLRCAEAAGAVAVHARWGSTTEAPADLTLVAHRPADVVDLLPR